MERLITEKFEIYAGSQERIAEAHQELDRAWRRFNRFVGDPPRIAVVIHDDVRQVDSFDPDSFEARGIVVLPWFDWETFVADVHQHLGHILPLGMLAESLETPGVVHLVVAIPFEKRSHSLQVGDAVLRVEGQPVATVKELQDALENQAEGARVTLDVRRGDEEMSIEVVCTKETNATAPQFEIGGDAAAMAARGNPLSHEVAHLMLIEWIEDKLDRKHDTMPSERNYGHPLLPDWLDEGVATICETAALQSTRRTELQATGSLPIALEQMAEMTHPMAGHGDDAREPDHQPVRIEVGFRPAEEGGQHAGDFYSTSLVLAEFLAQQGPSRCLGEIALALVRGRTIEDVLPELEGLPPTVKVTEQLMEQWLALLGTWQSGDEQSAVEILPGRCIVHHRGRTEVLPIDRFTGSSLVMSTPGGQLELHASVKDDRLTITHPLMRMESMVRIGHTPDALRLDPYDLPAAHDVAPDTARDVAERLAALVADDQAARHLLMKDLSDAAAQRDMREVDRRSSAFVLAAILEHGWIDAARFGRQAAGDAWLLVHHSNDLRLQITALPFIAEADRRGELRGAEFALFHDRVVQKLGGRFWADDMGVLRARR